ncbi:hypothetical protein E2320_005893 [Naja naja]|nr:hypothetical protein E2320_005893 [Naja naja]
MMLCELSARFDPSRDVGPWLSERAEAAERPGRDGSAVPKCLTLLIEIHPLNNVKVLKAVDSCIRVQFLYPLTDKTSLSDSCLLLISEDKYAEKLDIKTVTEGDRVEEERDILNCIQFYPNKDFKLIIRKCELQLLSRPPNYTQTFGCYSKTYTTTLEEMNSLRIKELGFLDLGEDAKINALNADTVFSPAKSSVLDRSTGKIFTVEMSPKALLQFLWKSKSDNDQLAALHCLLLHVGSTEELENQLLYIGKCAWNPATWISFYRTHHCRTGIRRIFLEFCVQNCKGFWEKLNVNLEYVKYVETPLHLSHKMLKSEWCKLLSDEKVCTIRNLQMPTSIKKGKGRCRSTNAVTSLFLDLCWT